MYANQMFSADSEARVIVKMMRAIDRASHSISSAFGHSNVYLSSAELVAQAEENIEDEFNISNCSFVHAGHDYVDGGDTHSGDEFHRYWTGGGTGLAWRVWGADGAWHAEARIAHRSGTFTPESTLLKSCESAGFRCEEVHSDFKFHLHREKVEILNSHVSDFISVSADEIRVPHGVNHEKFLSNVRSYLAKCESEYGENTQEELYPDFSDDTENEDLLGASTLSKLRGRKLKFDE